MKHLITLFLVVLAAGVAFAHYTVHSVSGAVKIESNGKIVDAKKGMALKATDNVTIPDGSKIEVLNDVDKRIYTSIKPGTLSVTRLMIDARGAASDHNANIASRIRFGKNDDPGRKIYVEKGMVNRSLEIYDPEGDNVEMDAAVLGKYIASRLKNGIDAGEESKIVITPIQPAEGGLGFRFENRVEFPVYFNVLRMSPGENPSVEISRLGQPAGSYVVLPNQTLSREHLEPLPDGERHFLILTHCQYDVDSVIDETNKALAAGSDESAEELPVSIKEL